MPPAATVLMASMSLAPVVAFHGSTIDESPFELLLDRSEVKKILARQATYCLMGHEHTRRRVVEDGVIYVSAPAFREQTVLIARATRDNSPPEATLDNNRKSSPGLAENSNRTWSRPCGV